MGKIRIAAVSTNGIDIDEHFGRAQKVLIYDFDGQLQWVEDRAVEMMSVGHQDHPFDPQKFSRIVSALHDCSKVFVSRIGDTPAAKLRELGIEPVVFKGAILDIGAEVL